MDTTKINLVELTQEYQSKLAMIKNEIILRLDNINNDNENINRIGNGSFTVNFSTIAQHDMILSPCYYDWEPLIADIKKLVQASTDPVNVIADIIVNKYMMINKRRFRLNEDMLEKIRESFPEL